MYATKKVMGIDRILFGTDYPYGETTEVVQGLVDCEIFNEAELNKIYRDTAVKLVPRLAKA